MKRTIIVMAFFLVIALALFGCLAIFGVMETGTAMDYMLKFGAGILLLGVCSIAISFLFKGNSES